MSSDDSINDDNDDTQTDHILNINYSNSDKNVSVVMCLSCPGSLGSQQTPIIFPSINLVLF
jgi:hypothetical protein